jgi:hypothetical protein
MRPGHRVFDRILPEEHIGIGGAMTAELPPAKAAPKPAKPTLARRVGQLALRLLVVLILGIALGVGLWTGVPAVYRGYIEPVRRNSGQIANLQATLDRAEAQAGSQSDQVGSRLTALETRMADLAKQVTAAQAEIDALNAAWGTGGDRTAELQRVAGSADSLQTQTQDLAARVSALEAASSAPGAPASKLSRQVQLLRALELLTQARLWLVQNNSGKAGEAIGEARAIVTGVAAQASEGEAGALNAVGDRLGLVLKELAATPAVAADDLEIAWKMLLDATAG